jgi:hypothetical protein
VTTEKNVKTEKVERRIPRSWFRASTVNPTMARFAASSAKHQRRAAPLSEGERELGWFVLPPFQRPPVWTQAQKARFIESCWMGLPIGVYIVNRPDTYASPFENWLLDGQQRVTAILEYVADEFPVFGHLFSELTIYDHRQWEMGTVFACLETNIENEAELREVYDRLAYGGTPHEPKSSK